jgi:hypothetical protein
VQGPAWAKQMRIKFENGESSYTDDQLAKLAGKHGAIFISKDNDFLKAKHKARIYRQYKCRIVYIAQHQDSIGYFNALSWLLKHWLKIKSIADQNAPCAWRLTKDTFEKMDMH